jgi:hypothetical protein
MSENIKPVILRFMAAKGPSLPYYIMGPSVEAILKETHGGTSFAGATLKPKYVRIFMPKARALGLGFLDVGIDSVRAGRRCFLLGSPPKPRTRT